MNQDKPSILKNKNGIIFFIAEVSFMLPYFNFYELVSGSYRTLFLVDFKVGFCSRAFIGEIVRLLTDNVTQQFLCAFALFNILLYLGMFSAMAGKVTYKASGKEAILVICTLFAVSRCSLRFYFSGSWTTIFDNFWLTALAFALVCIRYKSIKWMVPIVCVWSIGVHYGFIFSFLPCILAILLFEIYANKRNRIYNTIVFFVTALSSALSGIYFILFAPNNVNLTKQQAHEYLQGGFSEPLSFDLFDSYFYVQSNNGEKFSSMREMIVYWFKTFSGFELSTFLVILPAVLIFAAFWVYIQKNKR